MISRKSPIPLILLILLYALPCFGQWVPEGEIIYGLQNSMNNEFLVQDGSEGTFIFWTDTRAGTSIIYGQKVDTAGYKLWSPLGNFIGFSTLSYPTVGIPDGSGGAIVAWANYRAPRADIYAHPVTHSLLWDHSSINATSSHDTIHLHFSENNNITITNFYPKNKKPKLLSLRHYSRMLNTFGRG